MTWFDNPGRAPAKWPADTMVLIRWANKREALRPYEVRQLVWEKRGLDFDIAAFRRA